MGDDALTQPEAVRVLGQLYSANLIQAELPPDAEGLFRRHQKRRGREIRGWLTNVLFLRVPLFDPDRLLGVLGSIAGWLFTRVGFVLWLTLLGAGIYIAVEAWSELSGRALQMFQADHLLRNLPALYGAFVLTKVLHELGHGLACKRFGRLSRGGGEVHIMGIMFLIFAPMPYVDASSAWGLRSKLHRTIVGAAGMMTELALAAVAAMVWVWTAGVASPWQQSLHAASYYVMFISSVATIVFNANPLLRFDGYYILSDLLEIPNLAERSRQYVLYLVKRYAYGVRGATNPGAGHGEKAWLLAYGLASTAFHLYISVRILLMLAERYPVIGVAVAAVMAIAWLVMPLGRFLKYLAVGTELARTRGRALAMTVLATAPIAVALTLPAAPDRWQIEGTAEPLSVAYVHAGADGFVNSALPDSTRVQGPDAYGNGGAVLLSARNRQLAQDANDLTAEMEITAARRRIAQLESAKDPHDLALVQVLDTAMTSLETQQRLLAKELASLKVCAPITGQWVSVQADHLNGVYLKKGQKVGKVVTLDQVVVIAPCPHRLAGMLLAEGKPEVEIRLVGDPSKVIRGSWEIRQAGASDEDAPPILASSLNPDAAAKPGPEGDAFELRVTPQAPATSRIMPGQSVVVQIELPSRPILAQWWRSVRQMAQQRFRIF